MVTLRMTSADRHPEALGDLGEESVGLQAKPEQGEAEHPVAVEHQRVLPEGIADDVLRPGMVDAVDLDDEVMVGPVEIEVVAVPLVAAQHLLDRRRQPAPTALGHHIELTECAGPVEKVVDHEME